MLKIQKASAGSGKTYMLTYEYIKLLLGYTDDDGNKRLHTRVRETHRSILAITFTNKATEEMKQRIVKELAILAEKEKMSPYMQSLCECYQCSEDDIHMVAKHALWELLNDFSMFNISTIDSFFQVILRTFAREADVIYNYDIELRDEYAVKVGIRNMLASLSRNNGSDNRQLIDWLNKYMQSKVDNNRSWDIFKESKGKGGGMSLYSFAQNISTESFKKNRVAIKDYLSTKANITNFLKAINKKIEDVKKQKVAIGDSFVALVDSCGIDQEWIVKTGPLMNFEKIKEGGKPTDTFFTMNDECNRWFKKSAGEIPYNFVEGVLKFLAQYNEINAVETTYTSMIDNIYALGLLGDIDYHIEEFRKENDLILLSDTNDLLKKIISEDDAPFIYERIGVALKFFLIDEFQDTSRLQWENMRALLSESLSHNHDNLIIGDEKQSIYRFRNADPSLLHTQVYKDFSRHITSDSIHATCSTNWRSSVNVIKFNNTLFSILPREIEKNFGLPEGSISATYENVVQLVSSKHKDFCGSVKVDVLPDVTGNFFKTESAKKIPLIIEEYLNNGYRQKDIAILLDKRSDAEEIIQNILTYGNENLNGALSIVSDESLFLANSPSVKLVISVLRHLDSTYTVRGGDENSTEIRSSNFMPELVRQYEQLICAGKTPSESINEVFENKDNIKAQFKNFETPSTSLITITESIIKEYITVAALKSENAYIQAFQDVIIGYSSRYPISINLFLKWWDNNSSKLSVASSSDVDAINIMTIHKSKGLEFPCVIIPNCNWDINNDGELLWVDPKLVDDIDPKIVPPLVPVSFKKELQDSAFKDVYEETSIKNIIDTLNKTYVAFTRAVENLHIITPEKGSHIGTVIIDSVLQSTASEVEVLKASLHEMCDASSIDEVLLPLASYVEDGSFSIGEVQEMQKKEDAKKNSAIETFEMEDYLPGDRVNGMSYDLPDTLTSSQREKGNLYHAILSKIKREKDLDLVLRRARARGILLEQDEIEIRELLERGFKEEEIKSWFANGNRVMNERPIGNRESIYRPDRIIITPQEETIIIDYKFGAPSKSYYAQLKNYIRVLELAGLNNVIGKLWYPMSGKIETVEKK